MLALGRRSFLVIGIVFVVVVINILVTVELKSAEDTHDGSLHVFLDHRKKIRRDGRRRRRR